MSARSKGRSDKIEIWTAVANPNGERQDRQPRNDRRFGQQGERAGGDRPGKGRGDKVATAFAISNRVLSAGSTVRSSRAWISSP